MRSLRRTVDVVLMLMGTALLLGLLSRTEWAAGIAQSDGVFANDTVLGPWLQLGGWLLVMVNGTLLITAATSALGRRRRRVSGT